MGQWEGSSVLGGSVLDGSMGGSVLDGSGGDLLYWMGQWEGGCVLDGSVSWKICTGLVVGTVCT